MKIFKEEIRALIQVAYATQELKERDMNITMRHYGWDGSGGCSLQQTGDEYQLTRERVRQISNSFTKPLIPLATAHLTTLPGLVAELDLLTPAKADRVEGRLAPIGLGKDKIEGVLRAINIFVDPKKNLKVVEENGVRYLINSGMEGVSLKVLAHAQKACSHLGMVNIEDLLYLLPGIPKDQAINYLRDVLETRSDKVWLDQGKTWLWLKNSPRNRLITCVDKMLGVFSSTTLEGILVGANRYFHKGKGRNSELSAPEPILSAFLTAWGKASVSPAGIVRKTANFKQQSKLLELESSILDVIHSRPTKIAREKELENLIVPVIDGVTHAKKYRFSNALNYSPLIRKGEKRGEYVVNGLI
jgi:hypothetical protein